MIYCTGLTARWCPIHGACACPGRDLDSPNCPLHKWQSTHPDASDPGETPNASFPTTNSPTTTRRNQ